MGRLPNMTPAGVINMVDFGLIVVALTGVGRRLRDEATGIIRGITEG